MERHAPSSGPEHSICPASTTHLDQTTTSPPEMQNFILLQTVSRSIPNSRATRPGRGNFVDGSNALHSSRDFDHSGGKVKGSVPMRQDVAESDVTTIGNQSPQTQILEVREVTNGEWGGRSTRGIILAVVNAPCRVGGCPVALPRNSPCLRGISIKQGLFNWNRLLTEHSLKTKCELVKSIPAGYDRGARQDSDISR